MMSPFFYDEAFDAALDPTTPSDGDVVSTGAVEVGSTTESRNGTNEKSRPARLWFRKS